MSAATRELLRRGVLALRRGAWSWGLGIMALAGVSVAFWPSLEGTDALNETVEASPELMEAFGVVDLSTAAGYLDGQLYALMLPLLLSAMAIAMTSAVTAGDEDAGRLELLHALPVSRQTLWSTRLAAALSVLLAVTAVTAAIVAASLQPFSLDGVGVGRIVAATFATGGLAAFHAAVAYAAAGFGVSRGGAVGIAVAVLVAGYVASYLLPLSDALEGIRRASPWYWAIGTQPVTDGIDAGRLAVLVSAAAGLAVLGTAAVGRRDIRAA